MTPEQWQQEFRKELDALREPIERLCALTTLYPHRSLHNQAIRQVFKTLANEQKNNTYTRVDIAWLEKLYHLLALLPKPDAHLKWLKKRYEVSEIHQFALVEFIDFCRSWDDYHNMLDMEESEKDKVLEKIAILCQHWKELLDIGSGLNPIQLLRLQPFAQSEQLKLLQDNPPSHVQEHVRLDDVPYTCKPISLLFNKHPWNQKAKELLDQIYECEWEYSRPPTNFSHYGEKLHILSLMEFGMCSRDPTLITFRKEHLCDHIEYQFFELLYWTPIHLMHYFTAPMDDPESSLNHIHDFMEAETAVDGAIDLLYHLKEQITYRI